MLHNQEISASKVFAISIACRNYHVRLGESFTEPGRFFFRMDENGEKKILVDFESKEEALEFFKSMVAISGICFNNLIES